MGKFDRFAHALQAEKTIAIPRHVIFFDIESTLVDIGGDVTEHHFKLGWACYYRKCASDRREKLEWLFFKDPADFWRFVVSHSHRGNRLWVIAHNMGYDFTVAGGFAHLRSVGYKCQFFYAAGRTTLIKVKRPGYSIMFVDSLNWFRESLAVLGDRMGVKKGKIDFEKCSFSELKVYCRVDVLILVEVFKHLVEFLTTNRISRLCYTIGSTAMAAFLFRHYRKKIYIHTNIEAIRLERASYKGGRTECFYIGKVANPPFYIVDVNSLYPFVMRNNLFPVKYERIVHNISVDDLRGYLKDHAVIARVAVALDRPGIAVKDDRTIFPIGLITLTVTTPELLYIMRYGQIIKVHSAVVYKQDNIFKSFVDCFYALRWEYKASDNPLFEHFCKILMNSLYGKFGQKAEQWQKIADCPNEPDRIEEVYDTTTRQHRRLRYLFGELSELTGFTESLHSFPAIAAHVTAFARLHLRRLIEQAGKGNCFYCDTDSLFVNGAGLANLTDSIDARILGKLKLESTTDKLEIYGLKDYQIQHKQVIKGIKRNAVKISDTDYTQETWPTLTGVLRSKDTGLYKTHKQPKHLNRNYTKGIITDSGFVLPYYLDGFVEPY